MFPPSQGPLIAELKCKIVGYRGFSGIVFVGVAGIFLLQTGQETCFLPLQSDQNGISLCTVTQTNSNRTSAICKAQKRFIEVQLSTAFSNIIHP